MSYNSSLPEHTPDSIPSSKKPRYSQGHHRITCGSMEDFDFSHATNRNQLVKLELFPICSHSIFFPFQSIFIHLDSFLKLYAIFFINELAL